MGAAFARRDSHPLEATVAAAGTPIDLDKMRSLAVIGHRTRPAVREGRHHPETGAAWKSVTTEAGTVTEHNTRDDRVDAVARPETVRVQLERKRPNG